MALLGQSLLLFGRGASDARIGRKWPGVQCRRQSYVTVVDQFESFETPRRTPLTEKKYFVVADTRRFVIVLEPSAIRRIHSTCNSRCLFTSGIDIMVVRHSTRLAFGSVDDGRGRSAVLSSRKNETVCWQVSL